MLPDETTTWQLKYRDLFDREAPSSVEQTGIGITEGLGVLWRKTLYEGVDDTGRQTFSQFSLHWKDGYASIPIHFAAPDATLAKLRLWVFPEGTTSETVWTDRGPASRLTVNDALLCRLAYLHQRLATSGDWDAFYDAARRLLALCETVVSPDELAG